MISIKGHNLLSYLLKSLENVLFLLTCILPDYVAHEITKKIEKIAILKIGEPVSFWEVKTGFGKK